MQTLYRASVALTAAFLVLFSFGCDSDSGGGTSVVLSPTIRLNTGSELVSFNQELPLDTESFIVNVTGNDGDNPLENLAIREGGLTIPASRLNFRSGQTANNPILLLGDDASGFTYEIEIFPDVAVAGDVTYDFRLEDIEDRTATTSVIVTFTSNPPRAELLIGDGNVSGDATVDGGLFDVRLQLSPGDDSLQSLEILEDGAVLPAANLSFNDGAFEAMNPLVLLPEEQDGITFNIRITPTNPAGATRAYTFRIADQAGRVSETTVNVTFPNTDLTFDRTGIFFNASGNENGGLDLDTGTAVSFNSGEAEIEDEGIDFDLAGENWRRQVSATNDAVLKVANLSAIGDGLTFDGVLLTGQISSIFDDDSSVIPNGDDNFPDTDGDNSTNEDVTEPLQEGDVLVVRRGQRTYLVRIDAINFVDGTASDNNDDSYTVSIKY